MRFSTSRISISDRMKPRTFSRRSAGLIISRRVCLSSSLMPRCATIVSASRACLFIASSRARMDFWRPTKSGTTMCGKTMMSRSGRSGTRSPPPCGGWSFGSRLSFRKSIGPPFPLSGLGRLLEQDDRLLLVGDDLLRDENFLDVRLRGDVVHHVQHDVLHDGPQAARPRLPFEGLAG